MREMVTATLKSGVGQLLVVLISMGSMKILALMTGPAGVGLFSLLRNAQQTLTTVVALGGTGNGIVQGLASLPPKERDHYISTVFWISLVMMLLTSLSVAFLSSDLFQSVLPNTFANLLVWLIFPVAASAVMIFFRSILNANLEIGSVAFINVMVALGALLGVIPASIVFNSGYSEGLVLVLYGAFFLGAVSAIYLVASGEGRGLIFAISSCGPSLRASGHFLSLAVPTMIAAFAGMGSLLLIRMLIAKDHGMVAAGLFDVSWGIGAVYLTLFLTSLQTYLLPTFSSSPKGPDFRVQVKSALRLTMIAVVPVLSALIILKPIVVEILYSRDFLPALEVMRWTLLGDLLRAFGSILATALVARADMKAFLFREFIFNLVFTVIGYFLIPYGIWAAGVAYLCAYAVYSLSLLFRIWWRHGVDIDWRTLVQWVGGGCIVFIVSLSTWSDVVVSWPKLAFIGIGFSYSWIIMTKNERQLLSSMSVSAMRRIFKLG